MTTEQRDKIIKMAREVYNGQGCEFPSDDREMVEYLYDSEHPAEQKCLELAVLAHNIYNNDCLTDNDFFEWHGL